MFSLFKSRPVSSEEGGFWRTLTFDSVELSRIRLESAVRLEASETEGFVSQLLDEGLAIEDGARVVLPWDALYEALEGGNFELLPAALQLPEMTNLRPTLESHGSLVDQDFAVAIAGWEGPQNRARDWSMTGPLLTVDGNVQLLSASQWSLAKEVLAFARRPESARDDNSQRLAWGRLRRLALKAGAVLDDFLLRTVVLTPEKLTLALNRSEHVANDRVVEIVPGFDGAPPKWLELFDNRREVSDRYDVVTEDGMVQVLVAPAVKAVLQELKRNHRRVAGKRAQAFLLNPYATLGEAASEVIDEADFERARELAGLAYERFVPVFERDSQGYPLKVGLLIESASHSGPTTSDNMWLDDRSLTEFVKVLGRSLDSGYQIVFWEGHELEVLGDSQSHYEQLLAAVDARRQPPVLVRYADVHDLAAYSSRIKGIGVEEPYYSPYIAKKSDEAGWFPENVIPVIVYTPPGESEPVALPVSKKSIDDLELKVGVAKLAGEKTIQVDWLPSPLTIEEAAEIVGNFGSALGDIKEGSFPPSVPENPTTPAKVKKKTLVLRSNIETLGYEEERLDALASIPTEPTLPASIRPEFSLLEHQRYGLAWLQHLYRLQSDYQVRGAVLADDMGLGKTFQLLSLMAYLIEREPQISPMLVVAPVSLLENWAEEAAKFFRPGALPLLTAYGDALTDLRVPRNQVDERLRTDDGLVRFLRPDWVSGAKVVLTTYETLRDLEFSFASQHWSLMVCDEAQRIKNPAAMVTRAAKKQNADFRIACTGTPVENTLADLWCLFDFVQPGLLGALNDFGKRYRKPIEARNPDEASRVEELRQRIAPQILRRLKADVAKDLPKKIVAEGCRRLLLSPAQRTYYSKAVDGFRRRGEPGASSPFKNHLGLLQYLRLICTDPRPYGLNVFRPEDPASYRAKSPKLDWLLNELAGIKKKAEKAIVFCEFREIQRLLQHYIHATHNYRPDIINGDTVTAVSRADSRQKRLRAFQDSPGFGVIILSPVAVGFGVNIQAANHVIHFSRTWNPAKEDQATDRAYRIGAKKDVYVYYPVVHAPDFVTFDVKLDQLLTQKRALAEDMLNGAGDLTPGDFEIEGVVPQGEDGPLDHRVTFEVAMRMDWQLFEAMVTVLWSKRGYVTYRTPGSGDNGVDVVAISGAKGELIQVKTSGADGHAIGWDAVKEVVTGEAFYQRRHAGVNFTKVCLTNQYFNGKAVENAKLNQVELVDQPLLIELLDRYPVSMLEVEKTLYSDWSQANLETATESST